MLQSNTKLTKEDKQTLVWLKQDNPDIKLFSFPNRGVTVGITKSGEHAVAILGKKEKKFRTKVGEFVVLRKFENDETYSHTFGTISIDDTDLFCTAEGIAKQYRRRYSKTIPPKV